WTSSWGPTSWRASSRAWRALSLRRAGPRRRSTSWRGGRRGCRGRAAGEPATSGGGRGCRRRPTRGSHAAAPAAERRVGEPIVAGAPDGPGIAPIVVGLTVRREVDRATAGPAGRDQIVGREVLPGVARRGVPEGVAHHGLDAVTEVLQHLAHAALVAKAHHHEAARADQAAERRRVAPVGARPGHPRLVEAAVGRAEQPHLV